MKQLLIKIPLILSILLFAINNNALDKKEITYPVIERALNSSYIRVYSEKNLFSKPLSAEGLRAWNDTLTGVKNYVTQKSHNSKIINNTIYNLLDFAHSIENAVKLAKNSKAILKNTPTQRDQLAKILEDLQKDLRLAKNKIDALKKEKFWLNKEDRNEAIKILVTLYNILEKIAQQINKDALTYKGTKEEIAHKVTKEEIAKNFLNKIARVSASAEVLGISPNASEQEIMSVYKKLASEVLGISPKASKQEIMSAYKKLALEWHPDKNKEIAKLANEIMKYINDAKSKMLINK